MSILDFYVGVVVVIVFGGFYVAYENLRWGTSDPGGYMRRRRGLPGDSDESIPAPIKSSPQDHRGEKEPL